MERGAGVQITRFFFNKIIFLEDGNNMRVKFISSYKRRKPKFLRIKNYKKLTVLQVITMGGREGILYPFGSHFENGVSKIWHEKGLHQGYICPTLRPITSEEIKNEPVDVSN